MEQRMDECRSCRSTPGISGICFLATLAGVTFSVLGQVSKASSNPDTRSKGRVFEEFAKLAANIAEAVC